MGQVVIGADNAARTIAAFADQFDIVKTDRIIAVCFAAGLYQGSKQFLAPFLGQLTNGTIAIISNRSFYVRCI